MTENMHEILGIIAGILAIGGYVPYIISTLQGKTLPNKATWIIWTLVGGLLAVSYAAEGDHSSIWLPIGYFLGPLIIAILSFRYGYAEWTKIDKICLVIAILSIIPWLLSEDPTFTLVINVLIDAAGAIPTIIKTYNEPETEDFVAWLIFFIANTIQLFAISRWSIASIYPVYLFFLAGTLVFLILKGKITSNTKDKMSSES